MPEKNKIAQTCVSKMLENDSYSQWLGIEVMVIRSGYSKIKMTIRKEMLNGFGFVHGGITFAFCDSAFAFACNTYDNLSVALDCNISYPKSIQLNETIFAECVELSSTRKTGLYQVKVTNDDNILLALFKGVAFRTEKKML